MSKYKIIKGLPTYHVTDLEWIKPIADEAIQVMNKYINARNLKDCGTCVIGEGIKIYIIKPPRRTPEPYFLVDQPFQGGSSSALKIAQEYLESKGINCRYDCGRMD